LLCARVTLKESRTLSDWNLILFRFLAQKPKKSSFGIQLKHVKKLRPIEQCLQAGLPSDERRSVASRLQ
jgi:hypothetical protein